MAYACWSFLGDVAEASRHHPSPYPMVPPRVMKSIPLAYGWVSETDLLEPTDFTARKSSHSS